MARSRAAAAAVDWAGLPSDLVQQIAALLGDGDRTQLQRTCIAWCAAVEAVPELWPVSELSFGGGGEHALRAMFRHARSLNRHAWRVRVEHFDYGRAPGRELQQAYLAPSLLLQLPPTVRWVEVACPSAGAVLASVQHLSQLHRLDLTGNSAQVDWEDRGGMHALRALCTLRLDCQRDGYVHLFARVIQPCQVPLEVERLRAATQLSSLRLSCLWNDNCADMLAHLPALRDLRLDALECNASAAAGVVAALGSLPSLATLSLSIHACRFTDVKQLNDRVIGWVGWVRPPPMALLAAALTRLRLVGAVSLPPDWRQLSRLQRLRVENDASWAAGRAAVELGWEAFSWGTDALAALTAFTSLRVSGKGVLPDVALLATAPCLSQLMALGSNPLWQAEVAHKLPTVHLISNTHDARQAGSSSQEISTSSYTSGSQEGSEEDSEEDRSPTRYGGYYSGSYYSDEDSDEDSLGQDESD